MRLATNHAGWEVQSRDNLGWFRVAGPFATQDEARVEMKKIETDHEYRVVESLVDD